MRVSHVKSYLHSVAMLLFGILLPIFLLLQAYQSISALETRMDHALARETPAATMRNMRDVLYTANDYILYSAMASERENSDLVSRKQTMKITVINIGFAVMSIGLMFLLLGLDAAGGGGEGTVGGLISINFKTGSTGALIFVIGAVLAGAAGLLKSEYTTVPVPTYAALDGPATTGDGTKFARLKRLHQNCLKYPGPQAAECFQAEFEGLAGGTDRAH